jgi:hypothetical protein
MERHLDVLDKQRELIPTRAERLVLVVGLAQFNDQPGAQEGGRLTVQRELLSLIKLGEKLHNHIETMHRDSLDLLADLAGVRHPYLIANDLKRLLQAIPTAAIPTTPAHKGEPGKATAETSRSNSGSGLHRADGQEGYSPQDRT